MRRPSIGLSRPRSLSRSSRLRAEVDAVENLRRMLGRRHGANEERHGRDLDGTAEVNLVVQLRQVFDVGKHARHCNVRRPVDDDAGRGGTDIVHHQHHRAFEIGIGQLRPRDEEDRRQRLRVVGRGRPRRRKEEEQCEEGAGHRSPGVVSACPGHDDNAVRVEGGRDSRAVRRWSNLRFQPSIAS